MTLRAWRNTLAMLTVSLVVTFLLCELGLRLLAAVGSPAGLALRRADPLAIQIEPLGTLGFRQKPGARINYPNGTFATANALGYRGPVVTIAKPPGTFRVVLLGGSTTHGWAVSDSQTIDAYLRPLLKAARPDLPVEVINLAFDGYDSYQLLVRLQEDALRYGPDVVIVNAGASDVGNARFANLVDADPRTLIWHAEVERLLAERARGGPSLWNRTKHVFYLARLPQYLRELRRRRGVRQQAPQRQAHPEAADYFQRNMERLVDTATAHGSVVLLSTDPSSLRSMSAPDVVAERVYFLIDIATTQAYRDTLAGRMQLVATRLAQAGRRVSYVRLDSVPPGDFFDDAHLRPSGNRRVAARFADALRPLMPPPAPVTAPR